MRALVSHAPGVEGLRIETMADPVPGTGDVLIRVRAAALNHPDLLMVQDRYQLKPPRPFVPGAEAAGTVMAIGSGVTSVAVGDHVVGLAAWGGLAERLVVPEADCIAIPGDVPFADAAGLMVGFATSHYALHDLAALTAGETLLVLGAAGGIGLAAVQLGKASGAHVVAAVSSADKAALAREWGADATIVYPRDLAARIDQHAFTAAIRAACPMGHVDVILDPVGGSYAEAAFRALGWRGRYLVVGFTAGIPRLPLNLPLLKGARAIGVFYGDFARLEPVRCKAALGEILALHASGRIAPTISRRLTLDEAPGAFTAMSERAATGKIVIEL